MKRQENALSVLVGKSTAILADSTQVTKYTDVLDGQLAIYSESNTKVAAATDLDTLTKFRFGVRAGDEMIYSPWIKRASLTSVEFPAYAAAQQQISYLGFNGSSGSIDAANSTEYLVRLVIGDDQKTFGNKQMLKFGAYKSDASATQLEVVKGLSASLIGNFERETDQMIKFEKVINNAGTAITGTGTLTCVNGSKYVTAGTDVDAVLSVGDAVRIGGTGVTDPVYIVEALDTTNEIITLDVPYQGASATVAEASCEYVAAATVASADFGIKMTGVAKDDFVAGVNKYYNYTFKVTTDGFTSTSVTYDTAMSNGTGVYQQVAELEWQARGNRGAIDRIGSPAPTFTSNVSSASTYELIRIKWNDTANANGIVAGADQPKELIIACVVGSACGDELADSLETISSPLTPSCSWN